MAGRAFMVQGVGTNVGKSLIVAGLCRLARQHGLSVAPFKPQNMSNNAAVTVDGGEIGRAQALQARAAGVPVVRDMNPVLLKPENDYGSQVIVLGQRIGRARGKEYRRLKPKLLPTVIEAFERLKAQYELVIVEGAGSTAEVNLQASDFANMGFAEAVDIPVMLIGDIDRGGVIASLVGTHHVLAPEHNQRIKGFLVNKFRGDPTLFAEARALIADKTGWTDCGLLPWFDQARNLPAEDSVDLARHKQITPPKKHSSEGTVHIGVPCYPRIANFDDLDPLRQADGVRLTMIEPGETLPPDLDLVILPGSKSVQSDLAFFCHQGWDIDLKALVRRGTKVLGLCGGYQMLGRKIKDPDGIESNQPESLGLGLLDVETHLTPQKNLREVTGDFTLSDGSTLPIKGYEIHIGLTEGADCIRPLIKINHTINDGAQSANHQIMGTYIHGLFNDDRFRNRFLSLLGQKHHFESTYDARIDDHLDSFALSLATHAPLLKEHPWLGLDK